MSSERTDRVRALLARATRIDFVTLVESIERLHPGRPGVGLAARLEDEVVMLRHDPSLVFHSSDVAAALELPDQRIVVVATFLGATGSVSPLATYFTEDLLLREAADSTAIVEFYDLFHHRLLSLFYRGKQRGRPAFSRTQSVSRACALAGIAPYGAVAPSMLLGRARVLATRPGSKAALEAAFALAFPGLGVRITEFVSRPVQLEEPQRLRLGRRNHQLGRSARLGRSLQGPADTVRITLGPLDAETFHALSQDGAERRRARRLVDEIGGGLVRGELELVLAPGQEPRVQLGRSLQARLGTSALVRRHHPEQPVRIRLGLDDAPQRLRLAPQSVG